MTCPSVSLRNTMTCPSLSLRNTALSWQVTATGALSAQSSGSISRSPERDDLVHLLMEKLDKQVRFLSCFFHAFFLFLLTFRLAFLCSWFGWIWAGGGDCEDGGGDSGCE